VISRYTLPEMGALWTDEHRLATWVEVEQMVCEVLGELGVISESDLLAIRKGVAPHPERVQKIEETTNHDVIAFLTAFRETIPDDGTNPGRWIHHGLTSSDLLDTALAVTLAQAVDLVLAKADRLTATLVDRAEREWETLCVGRTHGIHAEPTTFGHKLGQFAFAVDRGRRRLRAARAAVAVGSLSGAVGTYSNIDPRVEQAVCERLGLEVEPVATQVVARDRHAELLSALAVLAASVEQLALEIRHLQRTEVGEAFEPFGRGQQGSSAMPHKRNPILCERICGLARVIRGNAMVAFENIALWHERDISHSSAERIILPDSLIAIDYQLHLAIRVVDGLEIDQERMRANLDATGGAIFSSRVLLDLVEQGMPRDDAYALVQRTAMDAARGGMTLRDVLARHGVEVSDETLSPESFLKRHHHVLERVLALRNS